MNEDATYFEVSGNGKFIRIELIDFSYPDEGWINVIVNVKAGAFSGEFKADFMIYDFVNFKNELAKLYDKLNGIATFTPIEDQVVIKIIGDGIGHLKAECIVIDYAGWGNKLEFEIDFDQTYIPKILSQLDRITTKFSMTRE